MTEDIDNKEPGLSLARARQEKNLTMDDVAARLHLSAYQIRLLEENDYEDLPEATYIKGYIRNYAQLLGIDSVVLVDAYLERTNPKKNDTVELVLANQQNTKVSDESKVMYSIVGIVVLVIAVTAIWIGSQSNTDKDSGQKTASTTEASELSGDLFGPGPDEQSANDSVTSTEEGIDAEKVSKQEALESEYPTIPSKDKAPNSEAKDLAIKQETEKTSQPKMESTKRSSDKIVVETNQGSSENKKDEAAQIQQVDELVLFFEQNSWVDVRDINDKKLLYKTVSEGRVVTVKGIAPFKIFLGNAEGVKLSYNGKQIDFEKYKRGLIARFTVGRK